MDRSRGQGGTLADFLGFLWRHKLLIMVTTGIPTLATVVYVLVVPVKYTSRATLLPYEGSEGGLFSAALALAGGDLSGLLPGGSASEGAVQEAVLRSERLADLIHEEFDLDELYETGVRERRLRTWWSRLETDRNGEGLLTVGYRDEDPELAMRIVTRLIEHLDRFNREFRSTSSRRARVFLEERLRETEKRVAAIEDSLARYQAGNQGMALSPNAESVVAAGARVLSERMRLETEVEVMRRTLGPEAPSLRAKEMEIQAIDEELARLPALNTELNRLLRDLQIHERTYAFLAAQIEDARLDEAKSTPTVDELDPPTLPEEKSWPIRTPIVALAFLLSGLTSLLLARVVDAVRELRGSRVRKV